MEDAKFRMNEVIVVGVSFAVVFLLRPNIAALWVVFCGYIFFSLLIKKEFIKLGNFMLRFLIGVGIVVLPILVYLIVNQALGAAVFQAWTFNIAYLDDTANRLENIKTQIDVLNRYFIVQLVTAYILVLIYRWRKLESRREMIHVLQIGNILLSTYLTFLSGRAYSHYLIMLLPALTISIVFLLESMQLNARKGFSFLLIVGLLFGYNETIRFNYWNMSILTSEGYDDSDGLSLKEGYIKKYMDEETNLRHVTNFIKENTTADERIYTHRMAGNLYLMSERLSSIRYFNLPAINLDNNSIIAEDFIAEFLNSDTRLVVISKSFIDKGKANAEKVFFEYILNNYELKYDENGYLVYIRS